MAVRSAKDGCATHGSMQVNTLLSAWKIGSQLEAASAGHSGNSTTSLEAGSQAAQTSSPTGKTGLKPEEICNGAAQSKVTPADPEAAFWDNLLSAKPLPSAPVARESQAEGTVEVARPLPSSSIKRTAKPSKTLRGPVSLAKESEKSPAVRPMESEGPLAIKSNHGIAPWVCQFSSFACALPFSPADPCHILALLPMGILVRR